MFEQMAEATAAILYLYDGKERRSLYVNQRISDILGYSSDEIRAMGSHLFSWLIHPDDVGQAIGLKQLLTAQDGEFLESEYRMKHANGEWCWFSSRHCVFSRDAEGLPQQILGTAIDITHLKQTQTQLLIRNAELEQQLAECSAKLNLRDQALTAEILTRQHLEARLSTFEDQLSHVLDRVIASISSLRVFGDRTWKYEYWSAGCEIIFGYTAQELRADQTLWTANVLPEDWETVLRPGLDHILAERTATFEYRFRHRDGSLRWISTHSTSRRDHEQDCWIVTAVEVDITDRKRIEEALRQQIQRSHLFAEVTQKIRQSLQIEEILRTTVTEIQRILNVDRVLLYHLLPNGSGRVVEEAVVLDWRVMDKEIYDPCFSNDMQHYHQGRISSIADITTADIQPCQVKLLQQFNVRSNLVVPVLQGDTLWGLLIAHQCDQPRQWSEFEIELLQQLANQVGIAIQQANLYQQAQQELVDRKRAEADLQQLNQELEQRAQERSAQLQLAISATRIGTWEWDLLTNVEYWSSEIYTMLNFNTDAQGGVLDHNQVRIAPSPTYDLFRSCVHPDDLEPLDQVHQLALEQRSLYEAEFRVVWQDSTIHWCQARGAFVYNEQGQPIKMVGMNIDITNRKQAEIAQQQQVEREAALYQQVQIELNDRQCAEAQLRSSLREKEVLLQEIHHRVKNNMQLVSSLLNLQASAIHDPNILEPFQESQQRIQVMALIHEQLYRANNLAKINFSNYVQNLATSLFQSSCANPSHIQFCVDVVAVELDIDIAIPCGLMINELVSNAIKYAFQDERPGTIAIRFSQHSDQDYILTVQDNGQGIPTEVDIYHTDSLGLQVVCALTEQLEGTLALNRENGTTFQIVFPVAAPNS